MAVWLTGISTGVLAVGVFVAWVALSDAKKTRHAQLVAEFSARWDSRAILLSLRLGRDYGPVGLAELADKVLGVDSPDADNLRDWYRVSEWSNLLETIAVMVKDGALPSRMIYRMWGGTIITAWHRDWKLCAQRQRDKLGDDNILRYLEELAGVMRDEQKREQLAGPIGAAILDAAYQRP
ncbi:MAG TPA: hypothetical protein VFA24_02820 [Gaiellaceae bacterium]|nr:hypothetical protein [Gaiellaceae bacterium]